MNRSTIACYVGAIAFTLYGIGHTFGYLSSRSEDQSKEFVRFLKAQPAEMPGVSRSRYELYEGYSLMTSVGMLAFGLLNLLLVRQAPNLVTTSRSILGLNVGVAVLVSVLSVRFFFLPPASLAILAAVAYLLGLLWVP
jgi:hypothetical protein